MSSRPFLLSQSHIELLRNLPSGISEWAIHPGLKTSELMSIDPEEWDVRDADYTFFHSEEFKKIIEEEHIILIS